MLTRCATQEAEGIEIGQLDLKDAVASEIFCKNRFASKASSFGLHSGLAIDYTTGGISTNQTKKQRRFKLRENIRPKLLVGSPEGKTWNQLQNLSKDNQLLEEERTHYSRHLEAVAPMYHGQVDDQNYLLHEHSQGFS